MALPASNERFTPSCVTTRKKKELPRQRYIDRDRARQLPADILLVLLSTNIPTIAVVDVIANKAAQLQHRKLHSTILSVSAFPQNRIIPPPRIAVGTTRRLSRTTSTQTQLRTFIPRPLRTSTLLKRPHDAFSSPRAQRPGQITPRIKSSSHNDQAL